MNLNNQIKERPITLNSDEVRAILEGRKTQIRVPIKNLKKLEVNDYKGTNLKSTGSIDAQFAKPVNGKCSFYTGGPFTPEQLLKVFAREFCSLGKVGDRLWVREKHRSIAWDYEDNTVRIQYANDEKLWCECFPPDMYLSDGEERSLAYFENITNELERKNCPMLDLGDYGEVFDGKAVFELMAWRSPVVMPQWASRLLLEITEVRAERVKNMVDCANEGFDMFKDFIAYFDKKHGKGSYERNPWVWVIEFKVIEGA